MTQLKSPARRHAITPHWLTLPDPGQDDAVMPKHRYTTLDETGKLLGGLAFGIEGCISDHRPHDVPYPQITVHLQQ